MGPMTSCLPEGAPSSDIPPLQIRGMMGPPTITSLPKGNALSNVSALPAGGEMKAQSPSREERRYNHLPKLKDAANHKVWLENIKGYCVQHNLVPFFNGTARKPISPSIQGSGSNLTFEDYRQQIITYHGRKAHLVEVIYHTLNKGIRKQVGLQLNSLRRDIGPPVQLLDKIHKLYWEKDELVYENMSSADGPTGKLEKTEAQQVLHPMNHHRPSPTHASAQLNAGQHSGLAKDGTSQQQSLRSTSVIDRDREHQQAKDAHRHRELQRKYLRQREMQQQPSHEKHTGFTLLKQLNGSKITSPSKPAEAYDAHGNARHLALDKPLVPAKRTADGNTKANGEQVPAQKPSALVGHKSYKNLEGLFTGILADRTAAMTTLLNVEAVGDVRKFFPEIKKAFLALGESGLDVSDEVLIPFILSKLARHRADLLVALDLDGSKPEEIRYDELVAFCEEFDQRAREGMEAEKKATGGPA